LESQWLKIKCHGSEKDNQTRVFDPVSPFLFSRIQPN
jgi:hypothetical protein